MSATLNFAIITTEIIIMLLQELAIVQAIVVERNLHAYYKLPIKQAQQNPQEYHILQCPFQNTTDIPTPEQMGTCVIVNSYREKIQNATTTQTTKCPLHIKIKYQMPRKHRDASMRLTRRRKLHPYALVIKPVRLRTGQNCAHIKPQRSQPTSSHQADHLRIVKKDNSHALEQRLALHTQKPTDQKMVSTRGSQNIVARLIPIMEENAEEKVEGLAIEVTKRNETNEEMEASAESEEADTSIISDEEFTDYDANTRSEKSVQESDAAPKDSVLKYLGTQKAIEKLSKRHHRDRPLHEHDAEKYFGEQQIYQRGEKVNGFQNYYHRDEIFNDHIFYDDLQQQGHYANRART